jgi:hypothetical protein
MIFLCVSVGLNWSDWPWILKLTLQWPNCVCYKLVLSNFPMSESEFKMFWAVPYKWAIELGYLCISVHAF